VEAKRLIMLDGDVDVRELVWLLNQDSVASVGRFAFHLK
jgi:hypothetical protein